MIDSYLTMNKKGFVVMVKSWGHPTFAADGLIFIWFDMHSGSKMTTQRTHCGGGAYFKLIFCRKKKNGYFFPSYLSLAILLTSWKLHPRPWNLVQIMSHLNFAHKNSTSIWPKFSFEAAILLQLAEDERLNFGLQCDMTLWNFGCFKGKIVYGAGSCVNVDFAHKWTDDVLLHNGP